MGNKGYSKAMKRTLDLTYPIVTVFIGVSCLGTALLTSSLGLVFSLSGATGFALLCNICPPWLYLMIAGDGEGRGMRIAAWALLGFGLLMMPVCITANFMAAFSNHEHVGAVEQCHLAPQSCDATAFCRNLLSSGR